MPANTLAGLIARVLEGGEDPGTFAEDVTAFRAPFDRVRYVCV